MARRTGRLLVVVVLLLAGCQNEAPPSNESLIHAYANGVVGYWVSGFGTVGQVYGEDHLSGVTTQRFQVRINDDFAVIIRYRVGAQGYVPVKSDTPVSFEGTYEWRPTGGVVNIDNHDESAPVSWIVAQDQRYE